MKRDMDLIRNIMLAAEEMPPGDSYFGDKIVPEGIDDATAAEHLRLLLDEQYLEGEFSHILDGDVDPSNALIEGISWAGHEFLDAIRDDAIWAQTKQRVAKVGGSVSVGTLTQIASAIAKNLLGL